MHGNVYQWCSDWYQKDYHNDRKRDPQGPDGGIRRVQRGGSYVLDAKTCRSALRYDDDPAARDEGIGFRVVSDVPDKPPPGRPAGDEPANGQGEPPAPAVDSDYQRALNVSQWMGRVVGLCLFGVVVLYAFRLLRRDRKPPRDAGR
jgi:hypothetical protein